MGPKITKPLKPEAWPKFHIIDKTNAALIVATSLDNLAKFVHDKGDDDVAVLLKKIKSSSSKTGNVILDVRDFGGYLIILGTRREISKFGKELHGAGVTGIAIGDTTWKDNVSSVEFDCALAGKDYPGRILVLLGPRGMTEMRSIHQINKLWVGPEKRMEEFETSVDFDKFLSEWVDKLVLLDKEAERALDEADEDELDEEADDKPDAQGSIQAGSPDGDDDDS